MMERRITLLLSPSVSIMAIESIEIATMATTSSSSTEKEKDQQIAAASNLGNKVTEKEEYTYYIEKNQKCYVKIPLNKLIDGFDKNNKWEVLFWPAILLELNQNNNNNNNNNQNKGQNKNPLLSSFLTKINQLTTMLTTDEDNNYAQTTSLSTSTSTSTSTSCSKKLIYLFGKDKPFLLNDNDAIVVDDIESSNTTDGSNSQHIKLPTMIPYYGEGKGKRNGEGNVEKEEEEEGNNSSTYHSSSVFDIDLDLDIGTSSRNKYCNRWATRCVTGYTTALNESNEFWKQYSTKSRSQSEEDENNDDEPDINNNKDVVLVNNGRSSSSISISKSESESESKSMSKSQSNNHPSVLALERYKRSLLPLSPSDKLKKEKKKKQKKKEKEIKEEQEKKKKKSRKSSSSSSSLRRRREKQQQQQRLEGNDDDDVEEGEEGDDDHQLSPECDYDEEINDEKDVDEDTAARSKSRSNSKSKGNNVNKRSSVTKTKTTTGPRPGPGRSSSSSKRITTVSSTKATTKTKSKSKSKVKVKATLTTKHTLATKAAAAATSSRKRKSSTAAKAATATATGAAAIKSTTTKTSTTSITTTTCRKRKSYSNTNPATTSTTTTTTTRKNKRPRRSTTTATVYKNDDDDDDDESIGIIDSDDIDDDNDDEDEECDDDKKNIKIKRDISHTYPRNRVSNNNKWNKMFAQLVEHKKKHNTLIISRCGKISTLGSWVNKQRGYYNKGELLQNRIDLMTSIGFVFDPNEHRWMTMYKRLLDYKKIHNGSTIVPDPYGGPEFDNEDTTITGNAQHLGQWVSKQRRAYHRKELNAQRTELLGKVNFVWIVNKSDAYWKRYYSKLLDYRKNSQISSTNVPIYYEKDQQLSYWVWNLKEKYSQNKLESMYIDLLNKINFDWSLSSNNDYDDYEDDKDDDDDDDEDDEDELLPEDSTDFCSNQNIDSKAPVVRRTRRQIDNYDTKWQKIFQKLVVYKNVHKNTMVPKRYDEDPPLGLWVSNQRQKYKNHKLLLSRTTLLTSIDFVWEVDDTKWMKMFKKLVAYKKMHKNTLITSRHKEDPKFRTWVSNQRRLYKMNKLLKERLDKLNSIGFV